MNLIERLLTIFEEAILILRWQDIIDVIIVAIVVYYVLILFRETRALQMVKGLAILLIVSLLAGLFELYTISWILKNLFTVGFVAVVIIFQPELRGVLINLGRTKFLSYFFNKGESEIYNIVALSVKSMMKKKMGGIIAFERGTSLMSYIDSGVKIDSDISIELITTIFYHNTPLHDGAIIIKNGKISAAGCILPVSQNPGLDKELGMRHRAALGLTEETDAVVVVVSEERRSVSVALSGKFIPASDIHALEELLILYGPKMEV